MEISGDSRLTSYADTTYDGGALPFSDNYFEGVLAFQVLEHVENLDFTISEIHRVCKPDGNVLITMPFIWPEHEMPYDFSRLTSVGIKKKLYDTSKRNDSKSQTSESGSRRSFFV